VVPSSLGSGAGADPGEGGVACWPQGRERERERQKDRDRAREIVRKKAGADPCGPRCRTTRVYEAGPAPERTAQEADGTT